MRRPGHRAAGSDQRFAVAGERSPVYSIDVKAALLHSPGKIADRPLRIEDVARPEPGPGQVLLRVLACGVCRTDLHIVEGELASLRSPLIPGHQIVGEIVGGDTGQLARGARVGVSWIGGTDGICWYCRNIRMNDYPE